MFLLRRPSADALEAYRSARADAAPTLLPTDPAPPGSFHDRSLRSIGAGAVDFDRARAGLHSWAAHLGAGVHVSPSDAPVVVGATVALVTRQLGIWVLASCRIIEVVDSSTLLGFTYATLPGHPERGWESFLVELDGDEVVFRIEAVSVPADALVRIGAPIARRRQRQMTGRYLDAMARWTGPTA